MDKIEEVKAKMPDTDNIYDLAELFKVFGDSTRMGILSALEVSDLCVSELSNVLGISVSAVSHQLRVLRTNKLVKAKKIGKDVIYSLDDDHVSQIIECGLSHINE
ncbi:MAG: metalloregulator ArsR/SmtB family transcription factor [Acholeplasmatales bacterium]|nr:metalloregulator ArsR/SmtB family transcription factor [Acholeplasmatales bacterium]